MSYNASYRKQMRGEVARKVASVLNAKFRSDDPIAFDRDDLRFIVGGACFKDVYDYVSQEALKVVLEKQPISVCPMGVQFSGHVDGKRLVIEHPIPVAVLVDKLSDMARDHVLEENEVREFLENYGKLALITRQEDGLLRRAKLNSTMPIGWAWDSAEVYERYNQVGMVQYDFSVQDSHISALNDRELPIAKRLSGRSLIWHPSALEGWVEGWCFADVLAGDDDDSPLHVYTDDRVFEADTDLPSVWREGTYEIRENSELIRVSVKGVKKILTLHGFTHKLSMSVELNPNIGNVYSAKLYAETRSHGTIVRDAIFVAAESVEFALRVFLYNGMRVKTVYTLGYHVGFNGCKVGGGVIRLLLKSLGCELYYSDEFGVSPRPVGKVDECVCDAYPELKAYLSDCGLTPRDDPFNGAFGVQKYDVG